MTLASLPIPADPSTGGGRRTRSHLRLSTAPKILLYSHDTFGLGNIRRTLLLSQALKEEYPDAAMLIVTGSPVIHAFRIPDGIDYVKLPCLDRIQANRYQPKFLAEWSTEVTSIRRAILKRAVLGFAPDLMIVDKRAAGVDGELLETLQTLRRSRRRIKLVLGIRDILDEPGRTRDALRQTGCLDIIEQYYDEVWIYGERSIFDAVGEYRFSAGAARKTHYCGYLKRPTRTSEPSQGPPRVLVTTGGGGDGSDLIRTYLEGLITLPRSVALRTTVVFGPEMPGKRRTELLERFGSLSDVTFIDFVSDLTQFFAASDLVVSMAGYNTVCEMLSFGRRAVLVPRAEPVSEQLLRARLFTARGDFDMVEPHDLTPEVLIAKVLAGLGRAPARRHSVDLDGLPRIRERARHLLEQPRL